jgi:hypothetical protein
MARLATASADDWLIDNQRYLVAALELLRIQLRGYHAGATDRAVSSRELAAAAETLESLRQRMATPPALERVAQVFQLSPFEQMLLLLCAAAELDASFASLFAELQSDPQRTQPTFALALASLPNPHWSAITHTAPLRQWHLIELGSGAALTRSPLRIDEKVLHFLAGVDALDERLAALVDPYEAQSDLTPSQAELASRIAAAWSADVLPSSLPAVQLCGNEDSDAKRHILNAACLRLGRPARTLRGDVLPTAPAELANLGQLWNREALLGEYALMVDCTDCERTDGGRYEAVRSFIDRVQGLLVIATRERWNTRRKSVLLDVHKPTVVEQRALWTEVIGSRARELNGQVDHLVAQFNLSAHSIRAAWSDALATGATDTCEALGHGLWDASRGQARPRLDDLAQRLETTSTWADLVLPAAQLQVLQELSAHVRQRAKVYETWGFGSRGARGLGITALFAGGSGTGKTLAAEVIARELRLDLYRIDLSSVVSKYIGETEKNLRRIFDAAEDGGAVLLFDEADALFGRRSEVKDSHDRYANIEVSYLLQRMEAYRGLAILTTNLKGALDPAFLRRIRFVVQFPFPDAAQRAEIWRRIFPPAAPTESLDFIGLARLNVAGGNIRNIALNAAFIAADAEEPVRMQHLLRAAQTEYAKLEKPLTDAEIEPWARL